MNKQEVINLIKQYGNSNDQLFKTDHGRVRANLISELWVGGGNTSFRVNREGVFCGATNYSDAPFKVSYAGVLTATGASISGAITATSGSITGDMTVTGSLTAGSSSASQVKIDSTGKISFRYDGDTKGYIWCLPDGSLVLQGDSVIYLDASGTDDDIYAVAGGDVYVSAGDNVIISSDDDISLTADDYVYINFNDADNDSRLGFYSNSSLVAYIAADGGMGCDGDFIADGGIQTKDSYYSSDGSEGENTTKGVINGIQWDGSDLQRRWLEFEFKDGILVDTDESSWEDV